MPNDLQLQEMRVAYLDALYEMDDRGNKEHPRCGRYSGLLADRVHHLMDMDRRRLLRLPPFADGPALVPIVVHYWDEADLARIAENEPGLVPRQDLIYAPVDWSRQEVIDAWLPHHPNCLVEHVMDEPQ